MLLALALFTSGPAAAQPLKILALGDSLTAGFGLPAGQGFAPQLERALKESGVEAQVIDAGVSGDTSAGGLARIEWALADGPDLVILELGANDMLRGVDPAETRANLDAMLAKLRAAGARVLLAGMRAAPNLGLDYSAAFEAIYGDLATKYEVPLYPFFLEGVATEPTLNLPDGLHPNAAGVREIVRRILPHVMAAAGVSRS
ncbi:MAG TPA: arylesterase [Methylomirabilota bacterium]|jgi:acyl-CoA thioesterase-1|nr:arylesterase [Methylomirabilota bacterium]